MTNVYHRRYDSIAICHGPGAERIASSSTTWAFSSEAMASSISMIQVAGFSDCICIYLSGWCRYGNGIDKLQEPADLQDHLFTALAFSYSSLSVVTTVTCMTSTLKPLPDGPGDSIRRSSLFALQSQRLSLLNLAPTLKPRSTCSEACIGSMLPYSCFSGCALLMLRLTGK